jgi:hypothetical protein
MVFSYSRGHKIYFENQWLYVDNNQPITNKRPCIRCGRKPTAEGYDACIGKMNGVSSACCGHGIEPPFILRKTL